MKTIIITISFLFFCNFSFTQNEISKPIFDQIVAIVSSPDFCNNINTIVKSMPDGFSSIKGNFTGSHGGGGFMSGGPSEYKWESNLIFRNVKEKGIIRDESRTDVQKIKSGSFTETKYINYKEYTCKYLLLTTEQEADWEKISTGISEVLSQCLPQINLTDWKKNGDLTLEHVSKMDEKVMTISIYVIKHDISQLYLSFTFQKRIN